MSHVLDPRYFGGVCEYIYNGEWRKLTYDPFCEHLSYDDADKYYRKPYNFLSYHIMVCSNISGSILLYYPWGYSDETVSFMLYNTMCYYAAHDCFFVFFFIVILFEKFTFEQSRNLFFVINH